MKLLTLSFGFISISAFAFDRQITQSEYVSTWSGVAVAQMQTYKIPASITMAQAILESGNGNSELARKGNNHFGIKCHDWTGGKMYIDDDQKGECFRVYESADESFRDHSLFLTGRTRYSKLFTYKSDDYKSWSKGLKEAGYATDPKYPDRLVEIIERLELYKLDEGTFEPAKGEEMLAKEISKSKKESGRAKGKSSPNDVQTITIASHQHTVKTHKNKIHYIVARKGDTFYKIAKEFGLGMWQLYKYNDYGPKKDLLEEGDIVYIQPKRNRSKTKNDVFTASKEISITQISQIEGIKVERILEMNNLSSPDETVRKGQKVVLR
jgi:LysM repeat protein